MNSKNIIENPFNFKSGEFSIPKVQNRTSEEYKNDKQIFEEAERGHNGCYFLTKEDYNKLSKQTQQELLTYTTYRGKYVSISQTLFFP